MAQLYSHLQNIEDLADLAEENIEELEGIIEESQQNLKKWRRLLKFSQTCAKLADQEAGESKKGQLRYKWTRFGGQLKNGWSSEAGDVCLKAGGKYEGFPRGLDHLRPFADGDRSANHLARRPKKDEFDNETTEFDTLVDCQLAVEKAHEDWQKKQKGRA